MQEVIAGLGTVPVIYYTKASHHLCLAIARLARTCLASTGVYLFRSYANLPADAWRFRAILIPQSCLLPRKKFFSATSTIVA